MSMMDKLKHMLKGHEEQAGKGVDRAGDFVDERTRGKHRRHVDTAQDRLKQQLGTDQPGQTDPGGREEPPPR
ncbi:antitoxin [Streptomyces sp. HM190]|uniref:antitoxin n=1 Tax=Streptomyces sp. HM190 TaxID=2695266 RepID=UPI0013569392|nr:antitoxin [Streptomyces sp. HM190]